MTTADKSAGFGGVRWVFLDRDGVINRKQPEGRYVTSPGELELLPGAAAAVRRLNEAGRTVFVVTNQRGVAQGILSADDLVRVHEALEARLADEGARLDAIYACTHDKGQCACRKPGIGMILEAFARFAGAGAAESVLIGDSLSDIECGRAAGMRTILIEGEPERRKAGFERAAELADAAAGSLLEAVGLLD